MSQPLMNQMCAVLWGGREIGRAITLAFARNGSEVAFADPSPPDVERLRDLLVSKRADVLGVVWPRAVTDGGESYREAAGIVLEKIRAGHPFFHRLILACGVDERFWSGAMAGDPPSRELIFRRLDAVLDSACDAMSRQEKPGRLLILWPADTEERFDPEMALLVREGAQHLRTWSREREKNGLGISLIWVGPSEEGLWTRAGGRSASDLLHGGEIGDAVVALAGLPRRVHATETTLLALDVKP